MSIYKKLLEVQKEVGAISKDSKNPFFKSKYFDINQLIEHVQPVLNEKGLVLLQPIQDGKVLSVLIDSESGDSTKSELALPLLDDPQKLGSCITYYRRYTLASLLGLQAEDDDANLASKKKPTPKPKKKQEVKDWLGLCNAISDPKQENITKQWALETYELSKERIEHIKSL